MTEKKLFILIGISSLVILVLGVFFMTKTQAPVLEQTDMASVEVLDEMSHDWGEIDMDGGNVEKTFRIRNTGKADLEVTNFKTSCMCTEVRVSIDGVGSPAFGMHTRSSWKGVISPGQTADVQVVFDPLFHGPQATGPITRLVSFNTSDSNNPTVELKLMGNVVKK